MVSWAALHLSRRDFSGGRAEIEVLRLAMAFAAKQRDWELSALAHRTYLEQCDGSSQQVTVIAAAGRRAQSSWLKCRTVEGMDPEKNWITSRKTSGRPPIFSTSPFCEIPAKFHEKFKILNLY